jgi:RNA polymerase sigma-70 factor (ECF subfamily)
MEEKKLIRLSQEGDEEAFSLLVNKYQRKVFCLAYSFTHNRETADDLAQEAFIKAYFGLSRFKFKSKFGTWLYRITINTIKDHLRKKERMNKASIQDIYERFSLREDEEREREMKKRQEERRKIVHQFIQTLPEKYRTILTLRDIQDFSYQEISKILQISLGTVDSRLHRARKMLRDKLKPLLRKKGGEDEM